MGAEDATNEYLLCSCSWQKEEVVSSLTKSDLISSYSVELLLSINTEVLDDTQSEVCHKGIPSKTANREVLESGNEVHDNRKEKLEDSREVLENSQSEIHRKEGYSQHANKEAIDDRSQTNCKEQQQSLGVRLADDALGKIHSTGIPLQPVKVKATGGPLRKLYPMEVLSQSKTNHAVDDSRQYTIYPKISSIHNKTDVEICSIANTNVTYGKANTEAISQETNKEAVYSKTNAEAIYSKTNTEAQTTINTFPRIYPKIVSYKCKCENIFYSFSEFEFHLPKCKLPSVPSEKAAQRKTHLCTVCKKLFTKNSQLIIHMRIHTGDKPYRCETCSKQFSTRSNLIKHMRIHTVEKPYPCQHCNKHFATNNHLLRHMHLHAVHKCNQCDKNFIDNSSLVRHSRIHTDTGLELYKCHLCTKQFSDSDSLAQHLRVHAGETRYECKQCGKYFIDNSSLVRHSHIHAGGKPVFLLYSGVRKKRGAGIILSQVENQGFNRP